MLSLSACIISDKVIIRSSMHLRVRFVSIDFTLRFKKVRRR